MSFNEPLWLPTGVAACLILLLMWRRYDARQRAALSQFVSAHLRAQLTRSTSVLRRRAQRGLFLAAVLFLFAALAGPLVGYRWEKISRRGNEVVLALDTSRSMLTPDVKPNRLTRAKLAIEDFVGALDGDAVGIVAFAGSAFLVCPMTLDYGAFHESLDSVDTGTIPRGGTNIASAIVEAQAAMRRHPGSDKILILVTDGEDLEGGALAAAQSAAKQDGLKIYAVGVGTAAGELIPLPPDQGGGFVKDENGAFVKSRLDESALRAIAGATGGFYVPLGTQGEGLQTIFNKVLGPMAKHELAFRQQKIYTERYQWPLAASLVTLLASLMIGTRRRVDRRNIIASSIKATGLLLIVFLIHPRAAESADAPAVPSETKKPIQEFNQGTADYRAGQFPKAAHAFRQSIIHAPSNDAKRLADQQDAYYNLGNTLYRTGQKTEQTAPEETIRTWTDAVKAYDTALQLRANDADSKYNRDLVMRKIEELQKQQQNKNQNKNQDQNKEQNKERDKEQDKSKVQDKSKDQNKSQEQSKSQNQNQNQPQNSQPGAGQNQPPDNKPGQGQPQPSPQQQRSPGESQDDQRTADDQRLPGQMSREEARELLDSAKSDERHPVKPALQGREADQQPEPPVKDW